MVYAQLSLARADPHIRALSGTALRPTLKPRFVPCLVFVVVLLCFFFHQYFYFIDYLVSFGSTSIDFASLSIAAIYGRARFGYKYVDFTNIQWVSALLCKCSFLLHLYRQYTESMRYIQVFWAEGMGEPKWEKVMWKSIEGEGDEYTGLPEIERWPQHHSLFG